MLTLVIWHDALKVCGAFENQDGVCKEDSTLLCRSSNCPIYENMMRVKMRGRYGKEPLFG